MQHLNTAGDASEDFVEILHFAEDVGQARGARFSVPLSASAGSSEPGATGHHRPSHLTTLSQPI